MQTTSEKTVSLSSIRFLHLLLVACMGVLGSSSASAQETWVGNTSNSWNLGTTANNNWSTTGVPSPTTVTYFATPGAGGTTITLDGLSNQTPLVQTQALTNGLYFNGHAYSGTTGYTIMEGSGTSPLSYGAYGIQTSFTGTGIAETLAVPLIAGLNGGIKDNIVLANYTPVNSNSVLTNALGFDNSGNSLNISGSITYTDNAASTANVYTLTMQGLGNGNISGPINLAGTNSLAKLNLILDTTGTWTLSNSTGADNTFGNGGTTTVQGGGTLVLDYTGSADNTNEAAIVGHTSITLGSANGGGGTLKVLNNAMNSSSSNDIGRLTVAAGADRVIIGGTGATQAYVYTDGQSIVRNVGGTLDVTVSTNAGDNGGFFAQSTTNSNNIIGGWATVNGGTDWASVSNTNPLGAGYVESYTQYAAQSGGTVAGYVNNTWATGNNTDVTTNGQTIAAAAVTNSLRFNAASALNLTLSGTTAATGETVTSGGILITPNVGANTVNISGGVLESQVGSGKANELILDQYDTAGVLNISSQILLNGTATAQVLTIGGGGKVILSGANSFTGTTTTYINQGTVQLGNASALGVATSANKNSLILGGQATLDLNGNSISVASVKDDPSNTNTGTVLANAGLTDNITNSAAGTIATFTVGASGATSASNAFDGGLTEASGAILGLSLTGTTTLQLGGNLAFLGNLNGSGNVANQVTTNYDLISGPISIGAGSTLNETGDTAIFTSGALLVNGNFGANAATQYMDAAANYLTGSGNVQFSGYGVLAIGTAGTVADTFTGSIGGPTNTNVGIAVDGTGTLSLPQITLPTNAGAALYLTGTSTMILPGMTNAVILNFIGAAVSGNSTLKFTGSGAEVSSGVNFSGGTVVIAPTFQSSSTAVAVSNSASPSAIGWGVFGGGTLLLSANGNQSVTLSLGNSANTTANSTTITGIFSRGVTGATLVIAAGDGLANLGTIDRLNFDVSAAQLPTSSTSLLNGIVGPWIVGQDSDANESGAFLNYSGSTANSTTDTGFILATPTSGLTGAGSSTLVARVNTATQLSVNAQAFGLEIDKNTATDTGGTVTGVDIAGTGSSGSIDLNGHTLTLNTGNATPDSLILNGGTITGTAANSKLSLVGGTTIYTSLAGGSISASGGINSTGNISIFGPGLLTIASGTALTMSASTGIYINSGVLDLAGGVSQLPTTAVLALRGGVLETNGAFTESLGTTGGTVNWSTGPTGTTSGVAYAGGGFAAQGGALTVAIGGTSSPTALVWGGLPGATFSKSQTINGTLFLGEYGDLDFGATNATNIVNFTNSINLGIAQSSPFYWRTVQVTANSADNNANPFAAADPAVLSGVISSGYSYRGLAVAGNGVLVMTGANTYTGATSISAGSSLLIDADNNLGTAPTAAYALNTTPGFNGGSITPGTLVIDGGGALGIYGAVGSGGVGTYAGSATTVALSSNRTILLASGATGATPANINVLAGTTASYGGQIADYINEVGSLRKRGAGTLALSGASTYSGTTMVSAGNLVLTGSLASSAVTVGDGSSTVAILSGTGTINGSLTSATTGSNIAYIAPGVNTGGARGTTGGAGTLTVKGALGLGANTDLDIDLSSTATTVGGGVNDLITLTGGSGSLTFGGSLTINYNILGGASPLTTGTYTLINGISGMPALPTITSTGIGSLIANYSIVGGALDVSFTSSGTTYTVVTTPSTTLLHQGETTTLTTKITNTGGTSADTLNYSGLGATSSLSNNLSPAATSSTTGLANSGGNASNAQTYTATNVGVDSVTNTGVSGTNHSDGTAATDGGNTGATVTVYSGQMIWTGSSGNTWGTNASWNDSVNSSVHAAPGLDGAYVSSDTATFDTTGNGGTVDLANVSPSLKAVTFNDQTSYNLTSTGTGTLQLNGTGSGLGTSGKAALVTVTTGTHTISAPVSLTTDANIAIGSVSGSPQQLTISGQISGNGGLTMTGTGTTIVSSATGNTYTGTTTVNAGRFYNNTTLGTTTSHAGAITVNGGQFAGSGTITAGATSATGMTIKNGGSLASGDAQSSASTHVDGTHLTLNNTLLTVGSSFTAGSANLTFDLGANNPGDTGINGGNAGRLTFDNPNKNTTYLSLTGSSSINFAGTTSISLVDLTDLNGTGARGLDLQLSTPYLLIHAASNADYLNLVINTGTSAKPIYMLSQNDVGVNGVVVGIYTGGLFNPTSADIAGNISTINISEFGSDGVTPLVSGPTTSYANPVLYLNGGNLEVVPEPGTWALMLGGLALLILVQRRRNKTN